METDPAMQRQHWGLHDWAWLSPEFYLPAPPITRTGAREPSTVSMIPISWRNWQ
jgi:hypothetical protein